MISIVITERDGVAVSPNETRPISQSMLAAPYFAPSDESDLGSVAYVWVPFVRDGFERIERLKVTATYSALLILLTQDEAESGSAPLASPTFTGVPAAPTAATATSTTQIATTAFVQANFTAKVAKLSTTALVAGSSGAIANALITANSAVTVTRLTQGGTFAPGGYQVALNAGVGYTITARKVDGTLENACTDTVCATIVY